MNSVDPNGDSIFGDIVTGIGDAVTIAGCATVETGIGAGVCVAGLAVASAASGDAANDIGKRRRGKR